MSITYDDLDESLTAACADRDTYAADLREAKAELARLRAEVDRLSAPAAADRDTMIEVIRGGAVTTRFAAWDLYVGHPADRDGRLTLQVGSTRFDLTALVPRLRELLLHDALAADLRDARDELARLRATVARLDDSHRRICARLGRDIGSDDAHVAAEGAVAALVMEADGLRAAMRAALGVSA